MATAAALLGLTGIVVAEPSSPGAIGEQQAGVAAASQESEQTRLKLGLSDPETRLILPWFLTEIATAVNEGKSVKETARELAQGL